MGELLFDMDNCIGEGTFGKIYSSKCRKYALKVFEYESYDYKDELKFLSICQGHPNVVKLFNLPCLIEGVFLVLELAESNLFQYIFYNDDIDVLGIGVQLFKGLEYIHLKNIIHADIKDENILVFDDGKRVTICDFGGSMTLNEIKYFDPDTTTVSHRAPEILSCQSNIIRYLEILIF